jgi:hypothetical protein
MKSECVVLAFRHESHDVSDARCVLVNQVEGGEMCGRRDVTNAK